MYALPFVHVKREVNKALYKLRVQWRAQKIPSEEELEKLLRTAGEALFSTDSSEFPNANPVITQEAEEARNFFSWLVL